MAKRQITFIHIVCALVIIVALGTIYYLDGNKVLETDKDLIYKDPKTITDPEEGIRYYELLQKAYKDDTYGGSTPEETLELFKKALEKGDIELASKYFVIEKQKETSKDLRVGKDNGALEIILSDLSRRDNGYSFGSNRFIFRTFDKDGKEEFNFELSLNPVSNKWKIESL